MDIISADRSGCSLTCAYRALFKRANYLFKHKVTILKIFYEQKTLLSYIYVINLRLFVCMSDHNSGTLDRFASNFD